MQIQLQSGLREILHFHNKTLRQVLRIFLFLFLFRCVVMILLIKQMKRVCYSAGLLFNLNATENCLIIESERGKGLFKWLAKPRNVLQG